MSIRLLLLTLFCFCTTKSFASDVSRKRQGGENDSFLANKKTKVLSIEDLVEAVKEGNLDEVTDLLNNGVCPDSGYDLEEYTPLMMASANGQELIADLLLEKKASPNNTNCCSSYQRTPLALALDSGHESIARSLLEAKAEVNELSESEDCCECPPLLIALKKSSYGIAEDIVKNVADIDYEDEHGNTALLLAVRSEKYDMVRLLLNYKADPDHKNRYGDSPRNEAEWYNDILSLFSDTKEAKESEDPESELIHACRNLEVDIDAISSIINLPRDIPIDLDCSIGLFEDTALTAAIKSGRKSVVDLLLGSKANPNQAADGHGGITPLMLASIEGHSDIVKSLLEANADKDAHCQIPARNPWGFCAIRTASMYALLNGHGEVLRTLMDAKADISISE